MNAADIGAASGKVEGRPGLWYGVIMTKKVTSSSKTTSKAIATLTVRDARTGKTVVVRGAGAMAGSDFKLRKGVSLLKPIAKQTLARTDRLKDG